jgi:hypothetical protein
VAVLGNRALFGHRAVLDGEASLHFLIGRTELLPAGCLMKLPAKIDELA